MNPVPIVLAGRVARLEPLAPAHAAALLEAGRDPAIWRYLPVPQPRTVADMERWISAVSPDDQLAFAIVHEPDGRVAGATRYMEIRRAHRGLEIGWTWIAPEFQRTALNTECKLLLLAHAFEGLDALRVQLKTDARNERSQRAIERLGAQREGVLRRHVVCPDGYLRDTVMYSIVREEWPGVRARLEAKLATDGPRRPG